MKLCFSTLGCPDWTIQQVAENAAAYGFHGVELRIGGQRHVDPSLSKEECKTIRQLFASKNIAIPIISGYAIFNGDDRQHLSGNYDKLLDNAKLAADLGAPYLRIFPGGPITVQGIEFLRAACNEAHKIGVTALLEIHTVPYRTGRQAAELLQTVNSPGLAILWDIGHTIEENESLEDTWKYVGKNVRHVHMKDHVADKQVLMGEGTFPAVEMVKLLRDNGYDGYYSLEWEKTWKPELQEPEVALPQYVQYMKGIV